MIQEAFHYIDWASHSEAILTISYPSLKKLVWGLNPIRQKLHQMRKLPSPPFHIYGVNDTPRHYVVCDHQNLYSCFANRVNKIHTEGHKTQIPDHLIQTVVDAIMGIWKFPNRHPEDLRYMHRKQESIGWDNFMIGRPSKGDRQNHLLCGRSPPMNG